MKKISISILAILSLIAAVSCAKEQFAETTTTGEAKLIVSASQDEGAKVFLSSSKYVNWVANDRLVGLNSEGEKYVSEKAGIDGVQSSADFQFNTWSGTPAYFMFNFDGSNTTVYDEAALQDGKIIAKVADQQTPVDSKVSICRWAPVTVGKAVNIGTEQEPKYTTSLKNVTGFLKVTFSNSKIQSLTIGSKEGVDLAGKISISTSSIDAGEPVATILEGAKTVTLSVNGSAGHDEDSAEEGQKVKCFNVPTADVENAYYIAVLPGTFTPVLTFTDNLGRTITKTAASPITVTRSELYNLETVDASVIFDESLKLPQTLTFTLGKEWNFKEDAPVEGQYGNQKACNAANNYYGETYTYNYTDASTGFQGTYPFLFCKHYRTEDTTHGYYYDSSKGIVFILSGACMSLPAIPNYSLTKVEMTCTKNTKLQDFFGYKDAPALYQFTGGDSADTYELTETVVGKQYYLYFYTSNTITISDLKLTYTKASTLEPVVLGFDYPLEKSTYDSEHGRQNPFTGLNKSLATSSDTPFYYNGYQFTPNTGSKWCWNSNFAFYANCNAPAWIKLPKIAGYKLSKVKFGAVHSKTVAIASGIGEIAVSTDLTEVQSVSLNETLTDGVTAVLNDVYDPAKDYYYLIKSNNTGLCKFLLTYRPL